MKKEFLELGTLLTREEAKKVRGGVSGQLCMNDTECSFGFCENGVCNSKDGICAAAKTPLGAPEYCTDDLYDAKRYATNAGWWCCNCAEAIAYCK